MSQELGGGDAEYDPDDLLRRHRVARTRLQLQTEPECCALWRRWPCAGRFRVGAPSPALTSMIVHDTDALTSNETAAMAASSTVKAPAGGTGGRGDIRRGDSEHIEVVIRAKFGM